MVYLVFATGKANISGEDWGNIFAKAIDGDYFDKTNNQHKFTWQPHGAQFTIKYKVPVSAVRFQIRRPPVLDFEETMKQIGFENDWVVIKECS